MKILQCKFCGGAGKIADYFSGNTPCPTCKGAGELHIEGDIASLTSCKFCDGKGKLFDIFSGSKPCDVCKGVGVIEIPRVTFSASKNAITTPAPPRPAKKEYDVAVSFAGEDRALAREYADLLKSRGISVFFDEYEMASLWGKNLYDKLDNIYRKEARYCVIFISKHYAEKLWTNHERKSAQARAFLENKEYILPIKLDDTEIPGILETVSYIDIKKIRINELVEITIKKLSK